MSHRPFILLTPVTTIWLPVTSSSPPPCIRQVPRRTVLNAYQFVGLLVPHDFLVRRVPDNLAAGAIGDIAKVGNGGDVMADPQVEDRLLARFHTVQKVMHVRRARVRTAGLFLAVEIGLFLFSANFPPLIVENDVAFG